MVEQGGHPTSPRKAAREAGEGAGVPSGSTGVAGLGAMLSRWVLGCRAGLLAGGAHRWHLEPAGVDSQPMAPEVSGACSVVGKAALQAEGAHQGLAHRAGHRELALVGAVLRGQAAAGGRAAGAGGVATQGRRRWARATSLAACQLATQRAQRGAGSKGEARWRAGRAARLGAVGHVRGGAQPAGARQLQAVLEGGAVGVGAGQHNVGGGLGAAGAGCGGGPRAGETPPSRPPTAAGGGTARRSRVARQRRAARGASSPLASKTLPQSRGTRRGARERVAKPAGHGLRVRLGLRAGPGGEATHAQPSARCNAAGGGSCSGLQPAAPALRCLPGSQRGRRRLPPRSCSTTPQRTHRIQEGVCVLLGGLRDRRTVQCSSSLAPPLLEAGRRAPAVHRPAPQQGGQHAGCVRRPACKNTHAPPSQTC